MLPGHCSIVLGNVDKLLAASRIHIKVLTYTERVEEEGENHDMWWATRFEG